MEALLVMHPALGSLAGRTNAVHTMPLYPDISDCRPTPSWAANPCYHMYGDGLVGLPALARQKRQWIQSSHT
jgi:hypothetical protein